MCETDTLRRMRLSLFAALPQDELLALVSRPCAIKVAKGESVYCTGDTALGLYLVIDGLVKVSRETADGRSILLAICKNGEVFGEMAVAGLEKRTDTAFALTDCSVLPIATDEMERVIEENPYIGLKLTRLIGFRREQVETKIEKIAFCPVPVRLAQILLMLADHYPSTASKCRAIGIDLTHRELGEFIGSNREAVSAALMRMRDDGVLRIVSRRIVLVDEVRLRLLSDLT